MGLSDGTELYEMTVCAFRLDRTVSAEKFVKCLDNLVRSAYNDGIKQANEFAKSGG